MSDANLILNRLTELAHQIEAHRTAQFLLE
jgi:hypothetical protein